MPTATRPQISGSARARTIGWLLLLPGVALAYLFWITDDIAEALGYAPGAPNWLQDWSIVIFGLPLVAIAAYQLYLTFTAKAYDLILAALLVLASPFIIIAIAMSNFSAV